MLCGLGPLVPGGRRGTRRGCRCCAADRDEARSAVEAAAGLWARGAAVDWAGVLRRVRGRAGWTCPPTRSSGSGTGWPGRAGADAAGLGLEAAGHPLLGAAVELPGPGGLVLTGRLSAAAQPWLADHVVAGQVLVPGTALAEMALRAGDEAGCARVEELALEAPLVLPGPRRGPGPGHGRPARRGGRRPVEMLRPLPPSGGPGALDPARGRDAGPGRGRRAARPDGGLAGQWPPPGAVPVDVTGLYEQLAAAGYEYGPAFRGLRAAWRRGRRSSPRSRWPRAPRWPGSRSTRRCWTPRCT